MLVSHRHKFIYLKTFKTAGSSVYSALMPYCRPETDQSDPSGSMGYDGPEGMVGGNAEAPAPHGLGTHASAIKVRTAVGRWRWLRYRKIASIRNPYDKTVSRFWSKARGEGYDVDAVPFADLRAAFRDWLLAGPDLPADTNRYAISGRIVVNRFLRFECLDADFATLCADLGLPPLSLGREKSNLRTDPAPFEAYYDPATAAVVAARYRFEFDRLHYRVDSWRGPVGQGLAA